MTDTTRTRKLIVSFGYKSKQLHISMLAENILSYDKPKYPHLQTANTGLRLPHESTPVHLWLQRDTVNENQINIQSYHVIKCS